MARSATPHDIGDDVRVEPPMLDYAAHKRQYNRFVHLLKWFIIHFALLLPALYFYIIAGDAMTGTVLLVLALGAFVYGILSIGSIRHDVEAAAVSAAETAHPAH